MHNILEVVNFLSGGYDGRFVEVINTGGVITFVEVATSKDASVLPVRRVISKETSKWCCDKGRLPSDLFTKYEEKMV